MCGSLCWSIAFLCLLIPPSPPPSTRHHDTLNAPVNVQSLYFTFQFYHFAPTTTVMAYLVQPNPGQQQQPGLGHDEGEAGSGGRGGGRSGGLWDAGGAAEG